MPTYRLTVEYDGTDFHGWQVQPTVRTVAGTLTNALRTVTHEDVKLTAAGRTDAGAHAHGQVVGVALERDWDPDRLHAALNAVLPQDLGVVDARRESAAFDARRDARHRTYRYVVMVLERHSPVVRRHAWTVSQPLDVDAMTAAANALVGTHDFAVFGAATKPGGSTVRTVEAVTVERHALSLERPQRLDVVVISIRADAFLRGMVRAIAGALVAVGQARRPRSWIPELLRSGAQRPAYLPVAPARGLHQWSVAYGEAA